MTSLSEVTCKNETSPPAAVMCKSSIHAFMKYSHASQYGIFSVPEAAGSWYLSGEQPSEGIATMRNIPSTNCIYRLTYARDPADTQTFTARLQIDGDPYGYLENPPIMLKLFSTCEVNNIIYAHDAIGNYAAYSEDASFSGGDGNGASSFSSEEIRRGIYAYHCDVDKWLPMVAMKRRVYNSILASDGANRLYAIGGKCDIENNTEECRHAQAYDRRTKAWQKLPPTSTYFSGRFGDALFFRNNLFAVSTDHQIFEEYDPVAGRWYRHDPSKSIVGDLACYGCRVELKPSRRSNVYNYGWQDSPPEEAGDGLKFSYGRCRLLTHNSKLYWVGLGTERNPIWLYDHVCQHFVQVASLHEGKNTHPKMANGTQIYDVVVF